MSDTTTPGRDPSGRFTKPEATVEADTARDDDMHPMSRLLFGWVSARATGAVILWGVILICAALGLADYLIERRETVDFASFNGFYGVWGFGALALAILLGWPLSRLLRRDEDYYGEGDETPRANETEAGK